jgi:hypothetical protein
MGMHAQLSRLTVVALVWARLCLHPKRFATPHLPPPKPLADVCRLCVERVRCTGSLNVQRLSCIYQARSQSAASLCMCSGRLAKRNAPVETAVLTADLAGIMYPASAPHITSLSENENIIQL